MDSQLAHLRDATDYLGRLLTVEAYDNDWRSDTTPEECTGLLGVKAKLQPVQSEHKLVNIKQ